jgi:periplasmic protein TonB
MKINAALIYRPRGRWLIWIAFGCAVAIHLTAIVFAENKSRVVVADSDSFDPEVVGIIYDQPPSPQEPESVTPPEQPPTMTEENEFSEENVTPRPIRPRKKTPVTSVVRSIGTGTTTAMHGGSVKALTMYAPRPVYPYEARRGGITGSGIAQLAVNSEVGNVTDARMVQSTGSAILNSATVEALRRWRFKPGVASNVSVPITYTLTGVSY